MTLEPFPTDWTRALCIAAHPDDLEYGTAAAVAAWTDAGKEISYLLATRGEAGIASMAPGQAGPLREQEERDGAREVGVHTVDFLEGFADGVVEGGLGLRRDLAREIRRLRPELVTTMTYADVFPSGGLNQADHRAVGLATIDAVAAAGNRWIFPELVEEGLEPWEGVRWIAVTGTSNPTHVMDVTETFDRAVASLAAHAEYLLALGPHYPTPSELLGQILGDPDQPGRYHWAATVHAR
ncbi:MAG: PIG-L deacetylase family protein [Ornithinimicrobium sp.]|uniref:PIG-L deacetylase family protein n=1 Tax=Ornithinimicrobium sp. TaxID=1977084 RepID=UPI0026DFA54E|nr:PIG-L deacetylase family protein [Ornithinimicrobium sp.]MDO5740712.1 PIG-L deacetylase family protein [Ornithinimicrobium sp.]